MRMKNKRPNILDPGFDLTLRPMRYPELYERYRDSVRNFWTVEELDFTPDVNDINDRMTDSERHMINRLVAFFATGDQIVSNNLVLNLYRHINSPEGRMYLTRQAAEESLHIQAYLTLLDTYIPDPRDRAAAFAAVENIPTIKRKADFCDKWIGSAVELDKLVTKEDRRQFLMTLICFAACVEGLFFMASFAYVFYLRSKGLLNGLAAATNLIFKDESMHQEFAFHVVDIVREEEPDLFTPEMEADVKQMMADAIDCESQFADDLLQGGVVGLPADDMKSYLRYCADQRLIRLGMQPVYGDKNPFSFLVLQDVQELSNFFERRVTAYQVGVEGEVDLDADF